MSSGIITRSKAAQLNRFVFEIGIIWLPNGASRNNTIGDGYDLNIRFNNWMENFWKVI